MVLTKVSWVSSRSQAVAKSANRIWAKTDSLRTSESGKCSMDFNGTYSILFISSTNEHHELKIFRAKRQSRSLLYDFMLCVLPCDLFIEQNFAVKIICSSYWWLQYSNCIQEAGWLSSASMIPTPSCRCSDSPSKRQGSRWSTDWQKSGCGLASDVINAALWTWTYFPNQNNQNLEGKIQSGYVTSVQICSDLFKSVRPTLHLSVIQFCSLLKARFKVKQCEDWPSTITTGSSWPRCQRNHKDSISTWFDSAPKM